MKKFLIVNHVLITTFYKDQEEEIEIVDSNCSLLYFKVKHYSLNQTPLSFDLTTVNSFTNNEIVSLTQYANHYNLKIQRLILKTSQIGYAGLFENFCKQLGEMKLKELEIISMVTYYPFHHLPQSIESLTVDMTKQLRFFPLNEQIIIKRVKTLVVRCSNSKQLPGLFSEVQPTDVLVVEVISFNEKHHEIIIADISLVKAKKLYLKFAGIPTSNIVEAFLKLQIPQKYIQVALVAYEKQSDIRELLWKYFPPNYSEPLHFSSKSCKGLSSFNCPGQFKIFTSQRLITVLQDSLANKLESIMKAQVQPGYLATKHLKFNDVSAFDEHLVLFEVLTKCKKLETLSLCITHTVAIKDIVDKLPEYNPQKRWPLLKIFDEVETPNLRSFTLNIVNPANYQFYLLILEKCGTRLRSFSVSHCNINILEQFLDRLPKLTLQELGLGSLQTLATLFDKLQIFRYLRKFACTIEALSSVLKTQLYQTLSKYPFLHEIELTIDRYDQQTRSNLPEFLQQLTNFPNLRKITVHTQEGLFSQSEMMVIFRPTQVVRKLPLDIVMKKAKVKQYQTKLLAATQRKKEEDDQVKRPYIGFECLIEDRNQQYYYI
ncbi:hypothetical protein FGO68_gene3359 [Halteria grandinella]|uniref:Uncharacterized protein n=1 Tax=Halteria grandinella TaxID=5974 RepID=A0A8J8SWK5_HALGN|nr:hypothetical protein FGO68_gene3359 [Halteria grandinella]